ncbi:YpbS family protein [Marinicrinis lubricantis]|uniref:YpbS family protein n=1 Tax=Marinicrinis lubricantis TaxID=2086470 RepID=A0ABW1IRC2_9BACL
MSVHKAITEHTQKMNNHLQEFLLLDAQREKAIEEAFERCKSGQPFSVDRINQITKAINEHAKKGISPTRIYVTEQMVQEYALRSK